MPINRKQHYISVYKLINIYILDSKVEDRNPHERKKYALLAQIYPFCNLSDVNITFDVSSWYVNMLLICLLPSQPSDNLRLCSAVHLQMSVKQYVIKCSTVCVC